MRSAFTLIEILIVVILLGIVAAIVVPQFTGMSDEAEQAAFAHSVKSMGRACQLFAARTGQFPEDASSGVLPAGMDSYISRDEWQGGTPIGGVWDTERDSFGVGAAVGIHFYTDEPKSDEYMQKIDSLMDDGNLATGAFRKLGAGRFYLITKP